MSGKWPVARIGDICSLFTGGTPSKAVPEYFEGGQIPWLVSGDVNRGEILECDGRITELGLNSSNAKYLPLNSVVIALAGQGKTRGTVAILRIKATCNQSVVAISPKDESQLLSEFLLWNLRGRYVEIRRLSGDDERDRRGLNMDQIKSIEIPLPPLDEQKRIVATLDQALGYVDELGRVTQSSLEELDALWNSALTEAFNPSISENQGTPVSTKWAKFPLGEVADIHNGGTPKTGVADYWDGGLLWVTPAEMGKLSSPYLGSTARTLSPEGMKASNTKMMPANSVIMSSRAPIGHLVINTEPMSFNQGCKGLIPNDRLDHKYLYYFLLSSKDYLNSLGSGTTFAELSAGKLKEVEIPLPPLDEQKRIVAKLDAIKSELDSLKDIKLGTRSEGTAMRSSILSSAFAGDL